MAIRFRWVLDNDHEDFKDQEIDIDKSLANLRDLIDMELKNAGLEEPSRLVITLQVDSIISERGSSSGPLASESLVAAMRNRDPHQWVYVMTDEDIEREDQKADIGA